MKDIVQNRQGAKNAKEFSVDFESRNARKGHGTHWKQLAFLPCLPRIFRGFSDSMFPLQSRG